MGKREQYCCVGDVKVILFHPIQLHRPPPLMLSRRFLLRTAITLPIATYATLIRANDVPLSQLVTYVGDYHDILDFSSDQAVVWEYKGMKNVHLIDFPSLLTQGRTFNRITHLIQQSFEPYKRVLSEKDLMERLSAVGRTMENMASGHDVLFDELALFFNLAKRDRIVLFQEEQQVLDFLLYKQQLTVWKGIYQAQNPNGVLISVPQVQKAPDGTYRVSPLARKTIVMHELSHGEYYTNPYYSEYCRKFWNDSLNEDLRQKFLNFLSKYNYSLFGLELVINEMQAYLMFTPDILSFSADKLGVSPKTLTAMRQAFRDGKPPTALPLNIVL